MGKSEEYLSIERMNLEKFMERVNYVRNASIEDIPRIAEIIVFGKRVAYRPIFQNDMVSFNEMQVVPLAEGYQKDLALLENMFVYDDGIVKGVINGNPVGDGVEISEFYVEPFFKGKGIGRALMEKVISQAKESDKRKIFLWVIEDNVSARKFYVANGFIHTGETCLIEGTDKTDMCYELTLEKNKSI